MESGRGSTTNIPSRVRPRLHLDIPRTPPIGSSLESLRSHLASFFNGRSSGERRPGGRGPVSPKSPVPRLGLSIFTSHRIQLPHLESDGTDGRRPPSSTHSIIDPAGSPSNDIQPMPVAALQSYDSSSRVTHPVRSSPNRPGSARSPPVRGADREEDSLLHLVGHAQGRRRRRKHKRRQRPSHPPGSLITRAMKVKAVRHRACTCLLLGIMLAVVLTICKAQH